MNAVKRKTPTIKYLKDGMKTYKRKWFQGKAKQDEIDGKYAKGVFHPPELNIRVYAGSTIQNLEHGRK